MMDKRREVLEKFVDMITDGQHIADGITMEIDTFLTELDKLEKEKMLGYVPDLAIDAIDGNIITKELI